MVHIQGISVGHALDIGLAGFGTVHSVFVHAVNLTIRGDLWTLLAEDKTDLPFGIRLALSNFQTLGLRRGDVVSVRAGFVGIGSRLVVDCRAACRWMPARKEKSEPGLERRLAVVARAVRGKSWHESASMARAVRSAVRDATELGDVLAKVVGRGPGATPAGDDVLVGVLAVLTSPHSGLAGARAAEMLGRVLLPVLPITTDVSGQLLRQATNGLIGRGLHELVHALIGESSPQQLSEKVRRVAEIGATSGADACEGLLAFAPTYFASGNERASA
jgi:hypothetical protein